MKKRTYQQNCSLALALDTLGERWTFLLVRELLTGPKRYKDLVERLPAMGTNLLANRLKELLNQGILEKQNNHYGLTDKGKAIEETLYSLIRWNMRFNTEAEVPTDALHVADWDKVAMKALFKPHENLPNFLSVKLTLDSVSHYMEIANSVLLIDREAKAAELTIKGSQEDLASISSLSDLQNLKNARKVTISGDITVAWQFLNCFIN